MCLFNKYVLSVFCVQRPELGNKRDNRNKVLRELGQYL